MNGLVDARGFWGFHAAWQAAVVAVVVLAVVWLGRRWPAPIRYGLLLVALAKFALPPVVSLPMSPFSYCGPEVAHVEPEAVVPVAFEPQPAPVELPPVVLEVPEPDEFRPEFATTPPELPEMQPSPSLPPAIVADEPWNWKLALLSIHLLGMALVGGWLALQWVRLRQLQRSACETSDERIRERFADLSKQLGMRRSVRLLIGSNDTVPCSFGLLRPVVIVPETLVSEWSEDLDRVLAHELAHHRRGDLWVNAVQLGLFIVWWFNPLYWLLHRSLRTVREDCCDDLLLATGIASPGDYCDTILRVASNQKSTGPLAIASSMADYPHPLEKRFRRIMDGSLRRSVRLGWLGLASVVVLAAVLLPGARSENALHSAEADGETVSDATAENSSAESNEQPAEAAETGERQLIKGRVVDENGTPIADADVWCPVKYVRDGVEGLTLHTKSDRQGEFRMIVPDEWLPDPFVIEYYWMLWAYADGRQIGTAAPTWGPLRIRRENREIEIVLPPQTDVVIRLLRADGEVADGARVLPCEYEMRPLNIGRIPEDLAKCLASHTDKAGLVRLPWLARGKSGKALVETPTSGQQLVCFSSREGIWNAQLLPTGPLEGRIVAPLAEHAAGVHLSLTTSPTHTPGMVYVKGTRTVETDRDGRFSIDHLATGKLQIRGELTGDIPWRLRLRDDLEIVAGKSTHVSLNVEPAVRVEGLVTEKGSSKPIRGVTMSAMFGTARESERMVTDQHGRYSGYVLPGDVKLQMVNYPPPFMQTGNARRVLSFYVPDAVVPYKFPTLQAERFRHVTGTLRDAQDKPMPQVTLVASPYSSSLTDEVGFFELTIPLTSDVSDIEYYATNANATRSPVEIVQSEPLVLRVNDTAMPQESSPQSGAAKDQPKQQVEEASAGRSNDTPRLAEPRTVVGQVVDESDAAVPGAKIWLPVRWDRDGPLVAKGVSDDRGSFRLEAPQQWMTDAEPRGHFFWTVWAYAPGKRVGIASAYKALFDDESEPVQVVLGQEAKTSVMVIRPDGSPAAGATVEPYHFKGTQAYEIIPAELVDIARAKTNHNGIAHFPELSLEGLSSLEIESEGLGRQFVRKTARAVEADRWEAHLLPVGRVVGRVVSDDPDLAAGVRLQLDTTDGFLETSGALKWESTEGVARVTTDADGSFEVEHLAIGRMRIYGGLPNEREERLRLPGNTWVEEGQTAELTLTVEPGVLVTGRVVERGTGRPIAGAELAVRYGEAAQGKRTISDQDGRFAVRVLSGEVSVSVGSLPGNYMQPEKSRQATIQVPADARQFELPPTEVVPYQVLSGRLIDHQGQPVSDAQVRTVWPGPKSTAQTDHEGRFELDRLPIDSTSEELIFQVTEVRHRPLSAKVVKPAPLLLQMEPLLTPETGTIVSGRIVDKLGIPVADARVTLEERVDENDPGKLSSRLGYPPETTTTDQDGRFEFPELLKRNRQYRVTVAPKSLYHLCRGNSKWITATGPATSLGEFVVDRAWSARGQVVNEEGKPITGATVTYDREDALPIVVQTNADGRFAFRGVFSDFYPERFPWPNVVQFGPYPLRVEAQGYQAYDEPTYIQDAKIERADAGARIVLVEAEEYSRQ